jgi:hypothetical protein
VGRKRALLCGALLGALSSLPVLAVPGPAAAGISVVPRPDHVVVLVEENHSQSSIVGNPAAPYITSLAQQNANFTQSFAVTHPSQPNYLHLFSGSNQGVTDDSCPHSFGTQSLGDQLMGAGRTFVGYSEDLPSAGYTGCTSGKYARKHSPWVNWPSLPAATNQPLSAFPTDFDKLPDVAFVIPNLDNDMHDGTIGAGDAWVQSHLGDYITWAKTHNSLFVLTFDEDDNSSNNQIATIFAGQRVVPGGYAERINHHSVLRTIEDAFGLRPSGAARRRSPSSTSGAASPATRLPRLCSPPAAPQRRARSTRPGLRTPTAP